MKNMQQLRRTLLVGIAVIIGASSIICIKALLWSARYNNILDIL